MLILLAIALLFVLPWPWQLVAFLVLVPLGVLELLMWRRTTSRYRHAAGAETLLGRDAVVSSACLPRGQVLLDGEIWEARCDAGAASGDRVRVTGRDGLTLVVEGAGRPELRSGER